MKKETKTIVVIGISLVILGIFLFFVFAKKDKELKKGNIDNGINVNQNDVDLNDYKKNIIIYKGGEYNINGTFEHSLIIDSKEKVILTLNNVTINSKDIAAIANINKGELIIKLPNDTINILKDNGKIKK